MPNFLDMILGVGAGKPQAPQSGFDKLISNPLLMNILAQQGHSLTPGPSPLGVVGRAGLATAQQKQANSRAELQKQFIEAQIGHLNRLPAGGKPQETFTTLTDDEERSLGLDPAKAFQRSDQSRKVSAIGGGGQTFNLGSGGERTLVQEIAKEQAKEFTARQPDVRQAVSTIQAVVDAKEQVKNGIISGKFADARLGAAKALNLLGADNDEIIANTETYFARTGGLVAQIIKQFGAGTGLSDADREFAANMSANKIELNEKSMLRILDMAETAQRNIVKNFNDDRARIIKAVPELESILPAEFSSGSKTVHFSELPVE